MADIEISYNDSVIASLSDSGTEVLETKGTFLADDIKVAYTKSSGGGGNVLVVNVDVNMQSRTLTLDKTWKDINDADFAVVEIPSMMNGGNNAKRIISSIEPGYVTQEDSAPYVIRINNNEFGPFETDSENGYPSYSV